MTTEPLRVAILNDDLAPATHSVVRLVSLEARLLAARGHQVTLIGTVRRPADGGEGSDRGVREIRIPTRYPLRFRSWLGLWNPRVVAAVDRCLRTLEPDVVHLHSCHTWLSFGVLRPARRHAARVLLTAHDMMLFWGQKLAPYDATTTLEQVTGGAVDYRRSWRQRLSAERLRFLPGRNRAVRRLVAGGVDTVIAVSHRLREALAQNGFSSLVTIYNGLEPTAMDVAPGVVQGFRRQWGLGDGPVLLFGGRLSALKGAEPLLAAVAGLPAPRPRLLVIGGGSAGFERHLGELVDHYLLHDQVVRTGWLEGDPLRAAFAAADVAVNPSLCFETFGLFNIEAALAAKPVISTFFGGASETVVDGATGLLVNPFRVDDLRAALARVLASPDLARSMGEGGRRMVTERFSAAGAVEAVSELFPIR